MKNSSIFSFFIISSASTADDSLDSYVFVYRAPKSIEKKTLSSFLTSGSKLFGTAKSIQQ
ncbi:MAG: hypothetical protein CM15mP58_07640 [Burkholderiaceae bacterium]|nr:MAG: hypothetical protein CM15mP58_07640 [Burkholderiaceae bacterium]